jgi:hypothetical protein
MNFFNKKFRVNFYFNNLIKILFKIIYIYIYIYNFTHSHFHTLGLIIKRSEVDGEQTNFLNMPLHNVRFKKLKTIKGIHQTQNLWD